jgi:hypothetical protein
VDSKGEKLKRKHADTQLPENVVKTGYYAFGANQLHIIRGLDQVLQYLERNHGLTI